MTKNSLAAIGAACLLVALAAPPSAADDNLVDANIKLIEAGESVPVARIPDGIYLRTVNDPDDIIWERLPEYRAYLMPAPPVHESVSLRYDEEDEGKNVYFTVARTSDRFYMRLRWHDATEDTETRSDRFRDGAAVQFALGDAETSYIMGTGPEEPVNIWYWRSDQGVVQSLAAGGPGSTTMLDQQPVSGASLYAPDENPEANQWVLVMSRPIASEGDHQVSFDRKQVPIAFALWQGHKGERDGLKLVSDDWILVDLSTD